MVPTVCIVRRVFGVYKRTLVTFSLEAIRDPQL